MKILKIGNSLIFGVVHYDNDNIKVVVNYVKKYFKPNEQVVFMGEGGDDNNVYVKGSEQEIIYKELNSYFKKLINDSWDGADLNVMNDQSRLYKLQKEKTGLSHNQILACNWASMVGQNKSLNDFSPKDYLNQEGIEFLKTAANDADLPLSDNLNNPTNEDFDTLYRLSFPNDHGDKHTKVSKVAEIFNEIRDHNLLNKFRQYQNKGYKVIATVGEGHIDLIKNMKNKKEVKEMGADAGGSFEAPLGTVVKRKINEEGGIGGSGSYDVPAFGKTPRGGRKNPLKIDGPDSIYKGRAVKDKNFPKWGGPDSVFVKIKDKCKKFPYCNQGDIGALEFIHEDEDLKRAIEEACKLYNLRYEDVEKVVINEIKKIFI
jgi:hypothetical protein